MARKRYKVGAMFGHAGAGRGYHVYIPILAENIVHAIARAEKMGGVKKKFKYFWHVEEVGLAEYVRTKDKWLEFKEAMWAREQAKKRKRVG